MRAGVRDIVFSSSCSVYGTPAEVPVVETAPIQPESVYAESKAMVERVLRWYGVTKGLRSASLRYFNAAGASHDAVIGEDWDFSINLIPLVMKAVLGAGPPVKVFGDDYPTPDGTGHPRLHPRRGPRRRPHQGRRRARPRAARRRARAGRQPRHRRRLVGPRRHPGDGRGRRARRAPRDRRPAGRRPVGDVRRSRRGPRPCSAGGPARGSARSSRPPTAGTRSRSERRRGVPPSPTVRPGWGVVT